MYIDVILSPPPSPSYNVWCEHHLQETTLLKLPSTNRHRKSSKFWVIYFADTSSYRNLTFPKTCHLKLLNFFVAWKVTGFPTSIPSKEIDHPPAKDFCKKGTAHSRTWKQLPQTSLRKPTNFFLEVEILWDLPLLADFFCYFLHFPGSFPQLFKGSLLKEHRASVEARAGPRLKLLFFCLEAQNRELLAFSLWIFEFPIKKKVIKWRGRWE